MPAEASEYLEAADNLRMNAGELLTKGEFRKSAEMIWGSAAQLVKALAASDRQPVPEDHGQLWKYVKQVAGSTGTPRLREVFLDMDRLHRSFYETDTLAWEELPRFLDELGEFQAIAFELIRKRSSTCQQVKT